MEKKCKPDLRMKIESSLDANKICSIAEAVCGTEISFVELALFWARKLIRAQEQFFKGKSEKVCANNAGEGGKLRAAA